LNISTNCDWTGRDRNKRMTKKWTLEFNLDHHKSEWKYVDELFRDDPDISQLGLPNWIYTDEDDNDL